MPRTAMLVTAAVVVLLPIVALAVLSIFARRPANLGLIEGRLAACPDKPNCVCSQDSDAAHAIEPLEFDGTGGEALESLAEVIRSFPRARVAEQSATYLHAEFTSAVFRYVDDVEFLVDEEAGVIHVRSASRAGRSDFGANRSRVEAIRTKLAESRVK